ncbi:MAG: ribosome biogenesis GTPase Der [Candidatus Omnitrophota bacterium]
MANKNGQALPIVAIVGRPNVGKSSLFNRLLRSRQAIVYQERGTTRDRISQEVLFQDRRFILTDTGGYMAEGEDRISRMVREQIKTAMNEANILLFVCDGQSGLNAQDLSFLAMVRKAAKPVFLVLNKADNDKIAGSLSEFYRLGFDTFYPVSALHDTGIEELMIALISRLPVMPPAKIEATSIKIAVVGRPNAGKSSFVNHLLNEERVIVDQTPGTTRDTIDTYLKEGDTEYLLIDTAGMRHKRKVKEAVDVYSMMRANEAIERSEVCLVLIDAVDGLVVDDLKILDQVLEERKCLIVAVNKWDLIKSVTMEEYKKEILHRAGFLKNYPIIFTSTKTGYNVYNSLKLIKQVHTLSRAMIPTSNLNRLITTIKARGPFAAHNNKLKMSYATQTHGVPPVILIFANNRHYVSESHRNYIENMIRKNFDYHGVPIHLEFKVSKGEPR